jgi:hypothetical protein
MNSMHARMLPALARVQQQIADLKSALPGTIVKTLTQAKMRAL